MLWLRNSASSDKEVFYQVLNDVDTGLFYSIFGPELNRTNSLLIPCLNWLCNKVKIMKMQLHIQVVSVTKRADDNISVFSRHV